MDRLGAGSQKTPGGRAGVLVLALLLLAACAGQPIAPASDTSPLPVAPSPATAAVVSPAATAVPPSTNVAPAAPSPTPTATVPPTLTPRPTPDPYAGLSIEELAARSYGGGLIEIVDTLEANDRFARYLITYPSDGLTIYGFMDVPNEGDNFPVALVLHGYIPPAEYDTLAYTRRYADALAEAGYFVIHPNYRNYPPSDEAPDPFRAGTAVDILNLIAIIREQSQDSLGTLRRANADEIHLLGHSMGGGVALRAITVNNEPYLRAAALYAAMSGDEHQNYEAIREWTDGRGGAFELAAPATAVAAISPSEHLERIRAAVAVYHSEADDVVPIAWSRDLCARLEALAAGGRGPGAPDCHFYEGQPHTFRGDGDALFIRRVIEFFDAH